MKIGILGSGGVAQALATGFMKHGHQVMLGTRETGKLAGWLAQNPAALVGDNAHAADFAEVVVLAAKGTAAAQSLRLAGAVNLGSKPVIDATNPIADEPPVNGVLRFFTGPNDSLMEHLQREFPQARLVKAFNSVGAGLMVNPQLAGGPPTMFICGNDDAAKKLVTVLLAELGWEASDMGKAEAARAIEPLCMLWCIPGFVSGDWGPRAFKLLH